MAIKDFKYKLRPRSQLVRVKFYELAESVYEKSLTLPGELIFHGNGNNQARMKTIELIRREIKKAFDNR